VSDDVAPIDAAGRQRVVAETARFITRGEALFEQRFRPVVVRFDLSGATAGMYRIEGRRSCIRYNPWLFGKYFEDNLRATVPHEVAHYLVHQVFGWGKVKPHGAEWRAVMAWFGADPSVTCNYDLQGIPRRRQRTHPYRCACREHLISTTRHNRVQHGTGAYRCSYCRTDLVYAP
jgi:SprT protein